MRIRLKEGKQQELILLAKNSMSWSELATKINENAHYLANDLKNERIILKERVYQKLCEIANIKYDNYIVEKLNDNWGRSKGGVIASKTSKGSLIQIKIPKRSERLAELIGAILGDGNITSIKKGKKIRVYQVSITGHKELDKNYHIDYLANLFDELFSLKSKERVSKNNNTRNLVISSKQLINYLIENELKPGNKIRNQVTIPSWIKNKKNYLKACIRGLIDTDGSIFRMSNQDPQLLRISFTNYNKTLLKDVKDSFILLGFNPSKIIKEKQIFLSRKKDISKYLKDIGFSNNKHINRLNNFNSPIV